MVAFYQTDNNSSSRCTSPPPTGTCPAGPRTTCPGTFTSISRRSAGAMWTRSGGPSLPRSQQPGIPVNRVADGRHQLDGDQQPGVQARAQSGRARVGPDRRRQHVGQHLRILGGRPRQRPREWRVRLLEPGTGDPCGGCQRQRHHRDALPVHARHLRRHAPRYHLRHRNRNARRRRAGDARLLLSRSHHLADAAAALLRRRGGPAQGGDHALGQQERIEPRLVFLFRLPRMRRGERRSRSGLDDYRRGGGDRLRHGQHLQAVTAKAGLEHSEARAAGRDRPLLRRLLVEAIGRVQSVLPAMHGHVLRKLERSGCRLAARWWLSHRQNGVRRAGQQQHYRPALRQFHQCHLRRCLGFGHRQRPDDHRPIRFAASGNSTCTRNCPPRTPAAARLR